MLLTLALAGLPGLAAAQAALPSLQAAELAGGALRLQFDRPLARGEGDLALWIDRQDVTVLLQRVGGTEWSLPAAALGLLGGAARIEVWLVSEGRWQVLASRTLDAPTSAVAAAAAPAAVPGAPQPAAAPSAWKPRIDLALKAQLRAEARGSEPLPPRPTYLDATLRAALQVEQPVGAATLRGGLQVAGSSYRPEALNFAARQAEAAKLDLAEYRFGLGQGEFAVAAGHLGIGRHPLLLEGFASRGLNASARGGAGWDLSLAAVNGSAITGFANPLGLADPEHQIHLLVAGQELAPSQPGRARIELSVMDASIRAIANFNRGEVPDAERIRGLGLRFSGQHFDGRARWDVAIGRVQHRAAEDPQLAAADALTPLADSTRSAWRAEAAVDLVRGWTGLAERLPLTLTAQWRHTMVEPLYKAVGSFLAADQDHDRVALVASMGTAQLQLFGDRKDDNLDRIASLLTTRTANRGLSLVLPATLWSPGPAPAWLPGLTLQWAGNEQRATDAPDFALSGLAATHRPDQANRTAQVALAWSIERAAFGLSAQRARQDNRQPGRELADFEVDGLSGQLSLPLGETFNVGLRGGRQHNRSVERDLTEQADHAALGVDWRPAQHWALALELNGQRSRDTAGNSAARTLGVQTQLTRRFDVDLFGAAWPGQWFVRHAWASSRRTDKVFGVASDGSLWTLQAGLGLSWGTP